MAHEHQRNLLKSLDIDAPYVTEIRRVLQNLARQQREPDTKVYLVTSARRGEGKSTLTGLLAAVSSRIFQKRTLVIDGDLRRPVQHHLMGVSQRPGLVELLRGNTPFEAVLKPTPIPQLTVIPSGRWSGSVSQAYNDDRFREILDGLRGSFDRIFVDAAPVVPVVEPMLMAEHADAVLLVAMAGETPVTMVRRMVQIISPLSSKVAGVILNNASEGLPYYYDYKYYGYEGTRNPRRVRPPGGLRKEPDPPNTQSAARLREGA